MSELKLYRAKLKTRKQIMAEIPREHQGWWADVCAGETLYLRDATEADLERCNLGASAPRDVHEYLCENIERGSLVRRIAIAELTEIPERGLVAHHNESVRLNARIQELEAELSRRTQPEATKPAQDESDEDTWRRLALQFDGHRMMALGHLRAMLQDAQKHAPLVEAFLKAPPMDGETVLAQRIAALAMVARGAVESALELAATTIQLFDDATLSQDNYMLDSNDCADIIRALKPSAIAAIQAQKDGHG